MYVNIRHNFFSLRVCKIWKSLPITVYDTINLNTFKNRLDKYWKNRAFRYHYESDHSETVNQVELNHSVNHPGSGPTGI